MLMVMALLILGVLNALDIQAVQQDLMFFV